ncbi:MAG: gluconate 2-dehydrogenase subunit 3 family protein [Gemmatimonadota bacterium]|nr:gluconate 2-dehydrogenase subunit 3 family protein [Gemmatimonadota bacterium]
MTISSQPESGIAIDRREAIRRVSALLGGVALVGGSALITACEREQPRVAVSNRGVGTFTVEDIAFLDEVAETILPETKTPGAKAANVGAFIALMVTDTYDERDQKVFRDGMRTLDEECRKANNAVFMSATPQQRLALLERLDREAKAYMDARAAAHRPVAEEEVAKKAEAHLPEQPEEEVQTPDIASTATVAADAPTHYFRMMKELTLLGYFTSEIGYTRAMRYTESPGRFDPCVPYKAGEPSWAPHA